MGGKLYALGGSWAGPNLAINEAYDLLAQTNLSVIGEEVLRVEHCLVGLHDAELDGYLPHNPTDGWGEIACKTIPGNRVDDCVEVGQTPGSHLASAVRQAAWQFHIRPPRKNGRAMIGEWILVHIDYSFTHDASGE